MIYWPSHEIKIKNSWKGSSFIFHIASIHAQTQFRKRKCVPFKIPTLEIREFFVTTDRLRATYLDINVGLSCVCGTDWDGLSTSLITIKVALLCIYGDTLALSQEIRIPGSKNISALNEIEAFYFTVSILN